MPDSPAAETAQRSNPRGSNCQLTVIGAVGARRIVKSEINTLLATIPANTVPILEKLGIQVRDVREEYVL